MRNVIIVSAISSGFNYIDDCLSLGLHPVVLKLGYNIKDKEYHDYFCKPYKILETKYGKFTSFIKEGKNYQSTLRKIRKYNPEIILPGAEDGAELAYKLSNDLGIYANDKKRFDYFFKKSMMQEALKEKKIRYIKWKDVDSVNQAVSFYKKLKTRSCIVKPAKSAASVGLHVCNSQQELRDALNFEFNNINYYGGKTTEMIVQQKINGEEYIVNTLSYKGVHKVLSAWKYNKVNANGSILYDTISSVNNKDKKIIKLFNYSIDVLDALGLKYGVVHGEYMIDKNGPVLIETNMRLQGHNMPRLYNDYIFGHHDSNIALNVYINPEKHLDKNTNYFNPVSQGVIKSVISYQEYEVDSTPILNIARNLESTYCVDLWGNSDRYVKKTIDLETAPAQVYLINNDLNQLNKDLNLLKKIENDYFYMFFWPKNKKIANNKSGNFDILELIDSYCKCDYKIILSNRKKYHYSCLDGYTIKDIYRCAKKYDYGIFDVTTKTKSICDTIDAFFALTKKINKGGFIMIPNYVYNNLPYASDFMRILFNAANFEELDPQKENERKFLIAKKM